MGLKGQEGDNATMPTVTVNFERCSRSHQQFVSDDEMAVSHISLSIDVKRRHGHMEVTHRYDGLHADLKQPVGSSFGDTPIEVSHPYDAMGNRYGGPINYERFQEEAESYCRGLMSRTGVDKDSSRHASTEGSVFHEKHSVTFESDWPLNDSAPLPRCLPPSSS